MSPSRRTTGGGDRPDFGLDAALREWAASSFCLLRADWRRFVRGEIAFERDGNLWLIRPGGAAHQLTRRGGSSPSWSPDGRYLAFVRDDHVFVVSRTGRHLRRLVRREASAPVWSPSGRRLAFLTNYDLYVARRDGKKLRRLLNYDDLTDPRKGYGDNIEIKAIDWRPLPGYARRQSG